MKLINETNKATKLWSVRLSIGAAIVSAVQVSLPLWQQVVPASAFAAITTLLGISAAVARVIKQESLDN